MLKQQAAIGVLDSGVGGLSVLKWLKQILPHEDFIYIGDTARTPYGPRTEAEVRLFVGQMLDYFEAAGVKLVVVACNTLTVLGVDSLRGQHTYNIIGMSKGAKLVLKASKNKNIGVLATEFTIGTGAHKKAILAVDAAAQVVPKACPKFVPLIEGEQFGSAALAEAIKEYTKPLQAAGVDTVILSCTHYPFIKKELQAALGLQVTIIDPAEETARTAQSYLVDEKLLRTDGGKVTICLTADLERGRRLAGRMFNEEECEFKLIKLG